MGFNLYITPTGNKSWRLAYRFMGKQKLLVIGPYPAISLKEARERREAAKKLLVDNIDPSTAKGEKFGSGKVENWPVIAQSARNEGIDPGTARGTTKGVVIFQAGCTRF